jgi:hypothetical protein
LPDGIAFKNDGTKMYMLGETNDAVYQYTVPLLLDTYTVIPEITTASAAANEAPTVATPILNGGTAITLTASTTASISATTTITDNNGWDDISTTTAVFYNSTTTESCSADDEICYIISTCTTDATTSNSIDVTCTANMWYFAIPTDTGNWASSTGYKNETWIAWIKAIDAADASSTATTSQEVNSLFATEVQEAGIDYGTVAPGATSTTPGGPSIEVLTTGNAPINANISGVDMESGANTIAADQQRFSLTEQDWGDMSYSATSSAQTLNLASERTTSLTNVASDIVYWAIQIPSVQEPGYYSGTNTIAATEDTIDW